MKNKKVIISSSTIVLITILAMVIIYLITGGIVNNSKTLESKYEEQNTTINNQLKDIKINDEAIFGSLMVINDNTLETEFGIRLDEVENYIAAVSIVRDDNLYIIIKPKTESKDRVKTAIKNYLSMFETTSGEEEINSVLEKEVNGYYIYIMSSDNDTIYNSIKTQIEEL